MTVVSIQTVKACQYLTLYRQKLDTGTGALDAYQPVYLVLYPDPFWYLESAIHDHIIMHIYYRLG